jgi:hypothetical protein
MGEITLQVLLSITQLRKTGIAYVQCAIQPKILANGKEER